MRKEVIKYVGAASVAMLFTPVIILVPHLFDFLYIKDNLRNILLVDFVVIPSILFYFFNRNKKKVIKEYEEASDRLEQLSNSLSEDIKVDSKSICESIIFEEVKKHRQINNGYDKSTVLITNSFYFLDSHEKIRVLKSIREIVKEGKEVISDDIDLYYAEEESDSLCLPVTISKRLERK